MPSLLGLCMLSKALNSRLLLPECCTVSVVPNPSGWTGNETCLRGSDGNCKEYIFLKSLAVYCILTVNENHECYHMMLSTYIATSILYSTFVILCAYPSFGSRWVHSSWFLNKRSRTYEWKAIWWDCSVLWFCERTKNHDQYRKYNKSPLNHTYQVHQ